LPRERHRAAARREPLGAGALGLEQFGPAVEIADRGLHFGQRVVPLSLGRLMGRG
jgi:hypothetical protein